MSDKRRRWGQFETPPEVVDLVLGFCLRRPGDLLLDPSCGQGVFLRCADRYRRWLANDGLEAPASKLWGVEIDPVAASVAQESLTARILVSDFFCLQPGEELPGSFDCVVGNPPYTRAEWLGGVADDADYKATIRHRAISGIDGASLAQMSKRSGLHTFFFLHGYKFLCPRGRFGFVVSNSWLDVDYGIGLKRFLLEHFRMVAIVESAVERWFDQARVNTCLVILERCDEPDGRARNRVRFARLWRPLSAFITRPLDSAGRAVEVENLIMRLLPGRSRLGGDADVRVRVVPQSDLRPDCKWGPYLRAPEVHFRTKSREGTVQLAEVARVRRGCTAGANRFFYLTPERIAEWGIEPQFLHTLLKSPKEIAKIRVTRAHLRHRVLTVEQERGELAGTNVLRYIEWGESQGFHRRPTCAHRTPWYRLAKQGQSPVRLAWIKGIWKRHFAPLLEGDIWLDQQFYGLSADPDLEEALAAVLNSTWVALQTELMGRSNLGEGVLWLAGYEVEWIRLPDLRHLPTNDRRCLVDALAPIADSTVCSVTEQVERPGQQALDGVVFDLLGLTQSERTAVVAAAVELTEARVIRAGSCGRPSQG